ncbi:MAG: FAD-binding protein [Acidimicrobiia bacterium]|nr:FAD-binding protein [Acidimicrobiia bacterium]
MTRLAAFADEIGATEPVSVAGGRTKWDLGGAVDPAARIVHAPSGVVDHDPAEMIVVVGAGTPLHELDEVLAARGQMVTLDGPPGATVGGTLMSGISGLRRRTHGPVRNALLQADYVSADGTVITAGGPTVKNVSGYDLCRLLVGSLGTIGFVGEVRLRTRPRPEVSRWCSGPARPHDVDATVFRPAAQLWDGTTSWVLLEGYQTDVDDQAAALSGLGLGSADGPPVLPPHRHVIDPRHIDGLDGAFVAEVGVGIVHRHDSPQPRAVDPHMLELGRRVKAEFDPTGRCNPGRDPYRSAAAAVPPP